MAHNKGWPQGHIGTNKGWPQGTTKGGPATDGTNIGNKGWPRHKWGAQLLEEELREDGVFRGFDAPSLSSLAQQPDHSLARPASTHHAVRERVCWNTIPISTNTTASMTVVWPSPTHDDVDDTTAARQVRDDRAAPAHERRPWCSLFGTTLT